MAADGSQIDTGPQTCALSACRELVHLAKLTK